MRALTILVVILAGAYSGYWFLGRGTAEGALIDAAESLETIGWSLDWDTLETTGFPSRFDTTLTGPRIAGPEGDFAWSAPFVQLLALAYRPTQVIAILPPTQVLTVAGEAFEVETEEMRASATVRPAPSLPLLDATVEIGATTLDGPRLAGGFSSGLFALRQSETGDADYDAFGRLTEVTLPPALGRGPLPATLSRVEVDGLLTLLAPLDRASLATGLPLADALQVRHVTAVWGDVSATATGGLSVDEAGLLAGSLAVEVKGWDDLVEALIAARLVRDRAADMLRWGGVLMSDAGEAVKLQVLFQNGRTFLGPISVGPAPRMR